MAEKTEDKWFGYLPDDAIVMKRKGQKTVKDARGVKPASTKRRSKESLKTISNEIGDCTRCKLHKGRTNIVFGEGNPKADLVFVGEAPGEQEDLKARPFVGRSGQLLDKMIGALGLSREDVYICNVVKCRPPNNRNPEDDEIATCGNFMMRQIDSIKPKVIIALGKFAAQKLLNTEERISNLRGKKFDFRGAILIPSFHPSYLLRNPSAKKESWQDLKTAAKLMGREIPGRRKI